MSILSRKSISSKDLEEFLKGRDVSMKRTMGGHIVISGPKGAVVVPVDREIGPGLAAKVRELFIKTGISTSDEFDQFVVEHSPALRKAIQQPIDVHMARSPYDYVGDQVLRQRLSKLASSPLDVAVREAGVVLEDRLRKAANQPSVAGLHGVALVDALFAPGKGTIIFSTNPAEQDGARLLYRGTMQYIRNPAMHKLVEYPEKEAHLYIGVVDSLLQLLSEVQGRTT